MLKSRFILAFIALCGLAIVVALIWRQSWFLTRSASDFGTTEAARPLDGNLARSKLDDLISDYWTVRLPPDGTVKGYEGSPGGDGKRVQWFLVQSSEPNIGSFRSRLTNAAMGSTDIQRFRHLIDCSYQ